MKSISLILLFSFLVPSLMVAFPISWSHEVENLVKDTSQTLALSNNDKLKNLTEEETLKLIVSVYNKVITTQSMKVLENSLGKHYKRTMEMPFLKVDGHNLILQPKKGEEWGEIKETKLRVALHFNKAHTKITSIDLGDTKVVLSHFLNPKKSTLLIQKVKKELHHQLIINRNATKSLVEIVSEAFFPKLYASGVTSAALTMAYIFTKVLMIVLVVFLLILLIGVLISNPIGWLVAVLWWSLILTLILWLLTLL